VCGGQSITVKRGNYRYDLGPHNIHSERDSVIDFLKKNAGKDFVKHKYRSQIYFRGHRINYPLTGVDVLRSINLLTAFGCGLSFIWAHFVSFFIPSFRDDGSYEKWIVNRFGRKFYNIYFGPYSDKVWKIHPSKISDIVAKKRIAVSGILELIHSIFFKKQTYHPENPELIDNHYHQDGVGAISDFFEKGIIEGGGRIIKEATVEKIEVVKSKIKKIYYSKQGRTECLQAGEEDGHDLEVLSSIPVNEMILMLDADVPENVKEAAQGLDFTSEVFLFLDVKKPDIFKISLLYFSEPEFPFNRAYDVGIFSRRMVPEGKNALCLEVSCNYDDDMWKADDEQIFEKCILPLEKHNLLNRQDIENYHTKRLKHAYPRFRVGYEDKLKAIFDYLFTIRNLTSFGREGLFTYANVDDVIWMGFEVAKNVAYNNRIKLSIKELLPNYISF
ncbi:MAG: hypothetical protein KKD11_06310, partial [Candidatus Omnitrophica bacterium]|nr:hypothetical protein [Candidatus Omnitrophota bacterium]